jgi:uncharacterized protein YprB with RNaseH-like and TPR domain
VGFTGVSEPRILIFDIEATGLKPAFGYTLCIGYRWLGESKVHCPSIMDYPGWERQPWNDKKLLRDFKKVYESADMVVGHYSKVFDTQFLTARMMHHGLGPLPLVAHVDTCFLAKGRMSVSKSLKNLCSWMGLKDLKTPVDGQTWVQASTGHKPSIRKVISHCKADIIMTTSLYLALRPLAKNHPVLNGYGTCRACRSTNLRSRGVVYNHLKTPKRRVECRDCGLYGTTNG